jgi:carbon storage regulator
MLVLSRKSEQSVLVGDDIVITVLAIDGDRVKLGIQAPRDVTVLRHEIHEQVQSANNEAASALSPTRLHSVAAALRGRITPSEESPS